LTFFVSVNLQALMKELNPLLKDDSKLGTCFDKLEKKGNGM
jgi:hypothetical protein